MQNNFFMRNRIEVRIMLIALTFMVGVFIFSAPLEKGRTATALDDPDTYSRNYLEMYCGSFANAVPMAVNPTATMAVLSIVGMVERSDELWPNANWLSKPRAFLEAIPLVRNAEQLPTANPWMAILFTVLTIALYVVRSIKACKAVSQETIDKVERIGGQVINVCLVLLQFTQAALAEAATGFSTVIRTGITVWGIILGVVAALMCAIVYFIVSKCIEGIEAIATGVPVVATNALSQVGKLVIHLFATIFQFVSVYLAAVIGLIFTVLCLLLLIKLQKYAIYYKYIYFNPIWRKMLSKGVIEIVSKKFPRRGRKKFEGIAYAIPVFSMRKYPKRLVKRELLWLIPVNGIPSLVRIRALRRVKVYPLATLYENSHYLYMQRTKRFIRILTEEKELEIIISSEYEAYLDYLRQVIGAYDFKIVEERRAAERQAQIASRKAARAQAKEDRRQARAERAREKAAAREAKRQVAQAKKTEH